eukprot:c24322_g1_i1 orf=383-1747(-)
MAGKRKAEGIALLSLYNDDGDEEDDEDEEDEDEGEEEQQEKQENQQEQEAQRHSPEQGEARIETVTEIVSVYTSSNTIEVSSRTQISPVAVVPSQEEDDLTQSPVVERPGNGTHGIIVDYAHDEGALSPDAEEGEITTTGRAVFGVGMQVSNGFFQGVTPPNIVNTSRPENVQLDEQSSLVKVATSQNSAATASPTTQSLDQEMSDAKELDTRESDLDTLADFLPPPPAVKCSEELQKKFSKFLALKNAGRSFNEELRKSKGYRNPDFLQRAVKHQEIDQIGSCFSKEIFDPHGYDPSDFYDSLALEFRREQERKEQAKKQSQRIDFAHGGVQAPQMPAVPDKGKPMLPLSTEQKGPTNTDPLAGSQGLTGASEAASKSDSARVNKKSKWDKVDADTRVPPPMPTVAKSALAAASAHSALLTANAGGGYASFVLQKRKEAEERSRGSDRKSDRK